MKTFEKGFGRERVRSVSRTQNCEKNVEGFAKLSEVLAEAQGNIFELLKRGKSVDLKSRLCEIFTYMTNKIWLIYKPANLREDSNERNLKEKLVEANLQIQDLKFKLQDFESEEKMQIVFGLKNEAKKYKESNKKLFEELSKLSEEYLKREENSKVLIKENNDLRQELSWMVIEKDKKIDELMFRVYEIEKENEGMVEWREMAESEMESTEVVIMKRGEWEREGLREQIRICEGNFKQLQVDFVELEGKFLNKCKECEELVKKNQEIQEKTRNVKKKSKSVFKSFTRIASPVPQSNIPIKQLRNTGFIVAKGESFSIHSKNNHILNSKIIQLENILESIKLDKIYLEQTMLKEKQIAEEHLNNMQHNVEELRSKLRDKETEKLNSITEQNENKDKLLTLSGKIKNLTEENMQLKSKTHREINELTEENMQLKIKTHQKINELTEENTQLKNRIRELEKELSEKINQITVKAQTEKKLTESNTQLLLRNKDLERELESSRKNHSILAKTHENCFIEKENCHNSHTYLTDKDSASLEQELKHSKSLLSKNQIDISKLLKEKEMLLQEIQHLRQHRFEKFNDDNEEKIKDLETHIMNLRSLLEVKEKIIKEYGSKQKTSKDDNLIKEHELKIIELQSKIVKYKESVREYQENLNRLSVEIGNMKVEREKVVRALGIEGCEGGKVWEGVSELKEKMKRINEEAVEKDEEIFRLRGCFVGEKKRVKDLEEEIRKIKVKDLKIGEVKRKDLEV